MGHALLVRARWWQIHPFLHLPLLLGQHHFRVICGSPMRVHRLIISILVIELICSFRLSEPSISREPPLADSYYRSFYLFRFYWMLPISFAFWLLSGWACSKSYELERVTMLWVLLRFECLLFCRILGSGTCNYYVYLKWSKFSMLWPLMEPIDDPARECIFCLRSRSSLLLFIISSIFLLFSKLFLREPWELILGIFFFESRLLQFFDYLAEPIGNCLFWFGVLWWGMLSWSELDDDRFILFCICLFCWGNIISELFAVALWEFID